MPNATGGFPSPSVLKKDADYVFYELTRSICPVCRVAIDAQVLIRDNKVYMRKRCPAHGPFEALVYGDAEMYTSSARFNKPGTIPLEFSTDRDRGCPFDCGLCPDHQQHACLGIIEVNSACDMDCPLCFARSRSRLQPDARRGRGDSRPSGGHRRQSGSGSIFRRRAIHSSTDCSHDEGGAGPRDRQRDAQYEWKTHRG